MDGIKIIIARCPMCGVVFPHRAKTRANSVNKCCGCKCSANMRVGKKPLCAPEEIEAKTVSLAELKALETNVQTQREAMRKAGVEAKERTAIERVRQVRSNMYEERNCAHCGVKFMLLKSKAKQGNGKYCNSACYHAATHQRVIATRIEKTCKKCAKVFYVSLKESEAGRGKYCSRDCQRVNVMRPARNIEYVPRPAGDPATTLDGKLSFTALPDFEAAIGQLMARGYSFRTPGRAFNITPPISDFYGLQWGKDEQKGAFVFFYTTKLNTFKCYASR